MHNICTNRDVPKYSDRQVCVNSVDPDETAQVWANSVDPDQTGAV